MRVSVVIPVFNEERTLAGVVGRVGDIDDVHQIVVVDDGSTDHSRQVVEGLNDARVVTLRHPRNLGKGAALHTAFRVVTGDVVVIVDADGEYDPRDIPSLIEPIRAGTADVVFGNRFANGANWVPGQRLANRVLTALSNTTTRLRLSDMEVGAKAFRRDVLSSIEVRSPRFGCEPELAAKAARAGWRIDEVPVSYRARPYASGKKVTWRDGVAAVWWIVRFALGD